MAGKLIGWLLIAIGFVLVLIALSGCGSSGILSMSDGWCAKHPEASPARCDRNPLKEYDVQGHLPPAIYGDLCPGRYEYGAYGTTITCWGTK